ncbi:NagC family transcriptional regulator [Gibbsiella quercinecans]|uniref:NagC family transcriptional regulator n=1 Tax=Gibbsiella quercinecans TaxID=929813 RepID=UPI002430C414|nr:NagC family transcriptional regulator [Gibbsiella quercinecans]
MDYKQQILNILHSTPASRVAMTKTLNITRAYMTKLTAALLSDGIIEECEVKDAPLGRPQQLLAVKTGRLFSINVMIRTYGLQASLNDYNTTRPALATANYPLSGPMSAQRLAEMLDALAAELCAQAGVVRERVKALGVALQGGIEQHSGVVRWCPVLEERNINLRDIICSRSGIATQIVNIAWCSCYMINKRTHSRESWVAFMPGFGSLGFGYCINGQPGLGDNGFYPEIVHLPYASGLENAFLFDPAAPQQSAQRTAEALFFAICCTAPIHNIKRVILTGELFEDYADLIMPITHRLLRENPSEHINTIRLEYMKASYNYSMVGLVQLSSDAITATLL